jgi:hypothetical protein
VDKIEIITDERGNKIVLIPDIIFVNKQNIEWKDVENYYTTRFALPLYDNEKKTSDYNVYSGRLVINCTSSGKMYLYDLVDIKKEASNPLKTNN